MKRNFNEKDFDKLKYEKIIIEGNKAKILLGDFLVIVTDVGEDEMVYTIFKNKELVLVHHDILNELIEKLNNFIEEKHES